MATPTVRYPGEEEAREEGSDDDGRWTTWRWPKKMCGGRFPFSRSVPCRLRTPASQPWDASQSGIAASEIGVQRTIQVNLQYYGHALLHRAILSVH
jgi:hypothetical protein